MQLSPVTCACLVCSLWGGNCWRPRFRAAKYCVAASCAGAACGCSAALAPPTGVRLIIDRSSPNRLNICDLPRIVQQSGKYLPLTITNVAGRPWAGCRTTARSCPGA
eukprot:7804129-Pyramimonas_sp.AAC.1